MRHARHRRRGASGATLVASAAGDLRGDLREFGDADLVALGQHHGAEHRVLELAHIAGPAVGVEQRERLGADARHALALLGGEAREEMPRQFGDVLRPLAQRRHRDRKHVQAVEQVLAEAAGLHVGDQVAVGGGDDAARRP